MADIQEAIVVSGIHTNIIDPVDGKSKNYKEVTTWWDGTPMNNSKVDGAWFRRKGTTYLRQVIDKEGELFLEKDTVAQLRALSPLEILFLRGGVYKGVKLNGYYQAGDTPAPIEYLLSTTSEEDDGGSVFEVGSIKLEHEFVGQVDLSYFGVKTGIDVLDNHERVNRAIVYSSQNSTLPLKASCGHYDFYGTVNVPVSNISIFGEDVANTTWWYNGNAVFINIESPTNSGLQGIKIRKIRFRDRLGNGDIALSFNKVRASIFDDVEIWGSTDLTGWHTAGLYMDGDQLDGSWNNKFKNFRCCNMDGYGHLLRTTQNNAVYFLNSSTENCGRTSGVMTWICGGNGVTFRDSHFENFSTAVRISPYDFSFFLRNVNFLNCYFEGNAGDDNRCLLVSSYDKDGSSRATNVLGLVIEGGYWNGHGSDHAIEVDYQSGNVLTGTVTNVYYRGFNESFIKTQTAGERLKISNREIDSVPLLNLGGSVNTYSIEDENGRYISNSINRYIDPDKPDNFYNIEKQSEFIRLNSSQILPSNTIVTKISAHTTNGDIILTLPLLNTLSFENEFFIFKGTNDVNTVTIQNSAGNQFNPPLPISREYNVLRKFGQFIHVVRDTTAGWRILNSGILDREKFITNRGEPNGVRVANSGAIYFETDNSDVVVNIWLKTLTDGDNVNWIPLSRAATPTTKGLVNQAAAVEDVTTTDATDDIEAIALVNELKAKINVMLASDRTSGQRAT